MSKNLSLPLSWEEWVRADAVTLAELIRSKQITANEAAYQSSQAVKLIDGSIEAVLEVFEDIIERPTKDGANPQGPLWGVPIYLKDLGSSVAGRLRECGSILAKDRITEKTDPLIDNLHNAGLVVLGRSTTAEMGMTYDTATNYRGLKVTRNPWNLDYTAGGSSGGGAALVAAGIAPLAHATDGAGSTRIPAAFTGLVGLKTTRGRLPPVWSANEYSNETFGEGVFSRTVRDTAAFLDAATSHYPLGKNFIPLQPPKESYVVSAKREPGKLRIGLTTGNFGRTTTCDPEVAQRTREVAKHFESLGHYVEEINDTTITDWQRFWPAFKTFWVGLRPAGWGLERDGIIPNELLVGLTPMAKKFWAESQKHDKLAILKHQAANNAHMVAVGSLFKKFDLILTPVFAAKIPKANGHLSLMQDREFEPFINELLDAGRYVIPASDAGIPAISLPAGKGKDGLPIGIQLWAKWGEEDRLLQIATQLEKSKSAWFGTVSALYEEVSVN